MRPRLESIDVVRGLAMVVMALDHTRDFFAVPGQNPTDLTSASPALFLTRWVTSFCAPVFFLLTGTAAYLSLRHRSPPGLSRFLARRGVWLLVLEVVVVRCFAYQFNIDYRLTMLLVLWALGWSMILLAALVRWPPAVAATLGALMIAGHNLLDGVKIASPVWTILHVPGFVLATPEHAVFAAYPLVPWVGVTLVGYGLGQVYDRPPDARRRFLWRLGLGLSLAFVALRACNAYGDPAPRQAFPAPVFTLLSFLNTTKYPPSLLFLLMTLGPAMIALWALDPRTPRVLRPAVVFGRVPLFYYVGHFVLIHALAVAVCYLRYGSAWWLLDSPDVARYPFTPPPGWGWPLPAVYLVWVLVVGAMYPLSRWFAGLKQRRSDPWLSYL